VTVSPSLKLCAVETETVDLIFCTFAFTWSKLLSIEYS
jgi:hypothetical protein